MNHFLKHYSDRLYKMEDSSDGQRESYLVLPAVLPQPVESLSLPEAVKNQTGHNGLLVFAGQAMSIADKDQADEFADKILDFFHTRARTDRAVLWLCEENFSHLDRSLFMGINSSASLVTSSLTAPLATDLDFAVQSGAGMEFDGAGIRLSVTSGACVSFTGARALQGYGVRSASLSLAGNVPGSFHYDALFQKDSFLSRLSPGFSISCPSHGPDGDFLQTMNFPLFSPDGPASCMLSFRVSINPARPYGRDAILEFLPQEGEDIKLRSFYSTIYGDPVYLQPVAEQGQENGIPARFVFSGKPEQALPLCPEGDFKLWEPSGHEIDLMCGIGGMEYIRFSTGDTLRFLWGRPGFVPAFPLPAASVIGEPVDLGKEPMDTTYLASWACLSQAKNPRYLTQPKGMCYYGTRSLHGSYQELLFQTETFCHPDPNEYFPLLPFGGDVDGRKTAEELERQIISRLRLKLLSPSFAPALMKPGSSGDDALTRTATSNGFLADLDSKGLFAGIYLANNDYKGVNRQLFFEKPSSSLMAAFQSNPLFLVINNPVFTGTPTPDSQPKAAAAFHNSINIGDWLFSFTPGEGNQYNDYKTVMIIKGCREKLYDPCHGGLVSNPMAWIRWQDFASPLSAGIPDENQMANLSTWLTSYCEKALAGEERYFSDFNRIVADENWQGILFLNVPLSQENFPEDLGAVLWGLPQGTGINAHHIGIHMTALKQDKDGLHQDGPSSLFGLIYYEDSVFADTQKPVAPAPGQYDFRLLSLKALFRNSALKDFENYAQLTIGSWFGLTPDHMAGGEYNSMLLKGGYQIQNGNLCYTLRGASDCLYYFENDYLNKIEVTQVKMDAPDSQNRTCCFRLGGFLDFKGLSGYDLFSYGNLPDKDLARQGLCFSNLVLSMAKETAGDSCQVKFAFLMDQFLPDLKNSACRPASLAHCLSLKPDGILQSQAGQSPESMGFLPVHTDKSFAGTGQDWFGLVWSLPMGTLGELASRTSISASLLLAFAPQAPKEEPKITLWMKLPGTGQKTGFLSLQNLISLSIDQIWLTQEENRFQLKLTDISLKLFSLLTIPPDGSTDFTLFGSSQEGEAGWFAKYRRQSADEEGGNRT